MDAGVIQAFKLYYRRQQVRHLIQAIDRNGSKKILVSDAIRYSICACDMISSTTINNYILPPQGDCLERPSTSANDDPTPALSRNMFDKIAKEFNISPVSEMTEDEFGTCVTM